MARDSGRGGTPWRGSRKTDPDAMAADALDDGDPSDPVNVAAVRHDDALLDAIAGDGLVNTDSAEEYQLATLLADWRAEIVSAPLPNDPDLETVVKALDKRLRFRRRSSGSPRSRLRLVGPAWATAAAAAAIVVGATVLSYNSQPGDPLWRVKEVVFSQQAQNIIAQHAEDDLTRAQMLIDSGRPDQAKNPMQNASAGANQVSDGGRKQQLLDRYGRLLDQLRTAAPNVAATLPAVTARPVAPAQRPPAPVAPGPAPVPAPVPGDSGGGSEPPEPSTIDPRVISPDGERPGSPPDLGGTGGTGSRPADGGQPEQSGRPQRGGGEENVPEPRVGGGGGGAPERPPVIEPRPPEIEPGRPPLPPNPVPPNPVVPRPLPEIVPPNNPIVPPPGGFLPGIR